MKPSTSKWFICGLLFLATLLNYLDRQTISVSAPAIADEMHLSPSQMGQLFSAFLLAYGLAQMFVGPILDRIGAVLAYAVAVALWSVAGASSALAIGFATLFATRVALGLCESPNWPLAMRIVTHIFPPSQRSLATGIFQSGTSVGALIAPPIIIYLTQTYNWRVSFVVMGAVGLAWSVIWLAWFRWQPEPAITKAGGEVPLPVDAPTGDAVAIASPGNVAEIVRTRAFWALMVATCFSNPLQYFYLTWVPYYLNKYAGVEFGAGLSKRLVVVYLAYDIGLWSGGAIVAGMARKMSVRRSRMIVTAVGVLCLMSSPILSQLTNVNLITALICVATFGLSWLIMNYMAFSAEVAVKRVSTAVGLLSGVGSLAGAGFMWLVGSVVEKYESFNLAFVMTGVMPLVALIAIFLSAPRKETRP